MRQGRKMPWRRSFRRISSGGLYYNKVNGIDNVWAGAVDHVIGKFKTIIDFYLHFLSKQKKGEPVREGLKWPGWAQERPAPSTGTFVFSLFSNNPIIPLVASHGFHQQLSHTRHSGTTSLRPRTSLIS